MSRQFSDDFTELLVRQRGVFARWQLSGMPVDLASAMASLRRGRYQRMHNGVYASFTGPPRREAELWAAVLRAGPEAALSYETAAELDGFAVTPARLIHVTVPSAKRVARIPGLIVHRSGRLDVARHPSRTPPRTRVEETALDLAENSSTFDDAFSWISRPCSKRLTKAAILLQAMSSRSRVRWRTELSLALTDIGDGVLSLLEYRYVRNVERPHGLPRGKRQALIIRGSQRQYLDNLYEELGLGVELDGQAYHPAEERWRDISRDNALAAEGILVLRYGWGDVTERACQSAAQFAAVARQRGWRGTLCPCGPACPVAQG